MSGEHKGGFHRGVEHGTIGDNDAKVTFTTGYGNKEGETLIADGHISEKKFWGTINDKGHDHYGSGDGKNNNGTERGKYTGPDH
jgi:hypothetical protein